MVQHLFRGFKRSFLAALVASSTAWAAPVFEATVQRPLRYHPEGTDFVIENGPDSFNRPLYGNNTAFRADAGDKPELSLFMPGRGGTLRFGIQRGGQTKWLQDAARIVARYRPGGLFYEITDPMLGKDTIHIAFLALATAEGAVARVDLQGAGADDQLFVAFGGADGTRGSRDGDIGTERESVSRFFALQPEYCRGNTFALAEDSFTLTSKPGLVVGKISPGFKLSTANAQKWNAAAELLASSGSAGDLPVVLGQGALKPNAPVYLALLRQAREGDKVDELPIYMEVRKDPDAPAPPPSGTPAASLAYISNNLPRIFDNAESHRAELAQRVAVDTPDPYINAAAAALCVAADGIWDEPQGVFMHGAVAWRSRLLGWRGPYSGDELGWHERADRDMRYWATRQNTSPIPDKLPPADASANLARNEAALHSNGDIANSHYDMNLVYIDAVFRHIMWTGDMDFAAKLWPVIERHLAWEQRLFRRPFGPEGLPLYEGYCCIWASDDLAYSGGGAAHSTAYNYYHNLLAARLAKALGKDPAPYEREAALIARAMQQYLWLGDRGWYAECKDYLGLQQAHPSAALWTLYHTLDCAVPPPEQAWEMTRFVDTQIAHFPLRGPGVPEGNYTLPTTNWMPYTWSTNNVVVAEVSHSALAFFQANRPDEAYKIFKGCLLDTMYLGQCPGNVGMATYFDMARNESQRDFGDGIGATSRTMIEGLFGIHPDALAGQLTIRPGFPAAWDHASLRHTDFTFSFKRGGLTESYDVESRFPKPLALVLQVPVLRDSIAAVSVDGKPAAWKLLADTAGTPRVEIQAPAAPHFQVNIIWQAETLPAAQPEAIAASGSDFRWQTTAKILAVDDPEHVLARTVTDANAFHGTVAGLAGHRTLFARLQQGAMTWLEPITLDVRLPYEIIAAQVQDNTHLHFRLRNNTATVLNQTVTAHVGSKESSLALQAPAFAESAELLLPVPGLPGAQLIRIDLPDGTAAGTVTNWQLPLNSALRVEAVDLASALNDRVTQIFRNDYLAPRSPFCSLSMPKQGIGSWARTTANANIDDSGLRRIAGENGGQLKLSQGLFFQTPGAGDAKNIAFTSQWDNYPRFVEVPLTGRAAHAYFLIAGSTNSMQSQFENGRLIVTYADGSTDELPLRNPTNFWPIDQDYLIDDYAFRRPEPLPIRVDLRSGDVRLLDMTAFKGRGRAVPGGAATIVDLPLKPGAELKSLRLQTTANEAVIGLMAASLIRE